MKILEILKKGANLGADLFPQLNMVRGLVKFAKIVINRGYRYAM